MTIFYVYVGKNWSLLNYGPKAEGSLDDDGDSLRSKLILEVELEDFKRQKQEEAKFEFKITFS